MNTNHETSTPGVYHLLSAGSLTPAVSLSEHLPSQVNDLPAFYYWKDAIVVGSYVHPAGKFSLQITRQKLDGYAENFARMKSNGVGVPILMDHAPSAAATLGWIVDVKRQDDRLMELHQFLGEEARDIGLRNKVSLGIDPDFVDGMGNRYGESIVHSAITPVPVVPGQGEFEPLELSAVSPSSGTPGEGTRTDSIELAMHAIADAAATKRDLAVARGALDPAVAEELFALLVRSHQGEMKTMMLSRQSPEVGPIALAVFDALSRNRPAALGETTSIQILSRVVPDQESLNLQQRMIALASGQRRAEKIVRHPHV